MTEYQAPPTSVVQKRPLKYTQPTILTGVPAVSGGSFVLSHQLKKKKGGKKVL